MRTGGSMAGLFSTGIESHGSAAVPRLAGPRAQRLSLGILPRRVAGTLKVS